MLKRLLLSGAALTALASFAAAQTSSPPADTSSPPAASAPASGGMADPAASAEQKTDPNLFTNIKGADVVGQNDESVGSVADLLIDSNGQLQSLVIAHGGLVGIGQTYRNYDVTELPQVADGKLVIGSLNTAALEGMPEYQYPEAETGRAATETQPSSGSNMSSSSAPAAGSSSSGGPSVATAPADSSASSSAPSASGDAAGSASASASASGNLWPVSYIVGATVGEGDDAPTVSDARVENGKVTALLLDRGSLGLGNKTEEVAFEEIQISGTPAEPKLAMASGGSSGSSAPAPDAGAPTAPPSAAPSAPDAGSAAPGGSSPGSQPAPAPAPAQ